MTAPPILGILTAGGFGCRAEGERLIVHPAGDLTDALRAMIRASKADLLAYLRAAANDTAPVMAPEVDTPHRLWLIRHADGRLISHSFCPPATEAEIRPWYPEATIEPEVSP